MAQVYTTGPCSIHVAPGGTALFLGHGENGARISIKNAHEPVMSDVSGTRLPTDMSYQGSEAIVSVTLTRWNEPVRQTICAFGNPGVSLEGIDFAADRGALFLHEGLAYNLSLVFPKSALAAYDTLRPAYRFLNAWLEGSTEIEPGTRPLKISLVWHCLARYDPTTGRHELFDFNANAAPLD